MGLRDPLRGLSSPPADRGALRHVPALLMGLSGFAGLGYQLVWTQQSALRLGHESAAVLAVVAAFFGGLAVGSLALGPRIEASTRPARWYAAAELVIGAWSLLLAAGLRPVNEWALALTGVQPTPLWQWTVAFGATFVLLLPATAAMGATIPAMERVIAQLRVERRSIAGLYAANTFGAVAGVLAIGFWLIPAIGLIRTAVICVAVNLSCAGAALAALPRAAPLAPATATRDARAAGRALGTVAITGLLGIGYEVLVVRVLSQVAEDTVYTFAMLLAVYLLGTAAGAAIYARYLAPRVRHDGAHLFAALGAACAIGTASLWFAERSKELALLAFGPSEAAAIAAEGAIALVAFGPPTLVMGALFSHLCSRANAAGVSFGRVLGLNTLGAAAAPLVFGVLALPPLGAKAALLAIGAAYILLAGRGAWRSPAAWVPAAGIAVLAALAPPLAFVDVPPGGNVVSYAEGVTAAVSVVEDADGVARLRIDNRQQEGSSGTARVDSRQAWLPVLLHPAPRRALFLGLGTGVTAAAAAEDPGLRVDAVELLPEVIAASARFAGVLSEQARARVRVVAADARRYVRTNGDGYDVIVADNFHPARSGSGSLYTVEHFAAVRERLAPGGVFCQWLPLHQLDLATLRSIVRSFIAVYPNASAMLASNSLETPVVGLVGRAAAGAFDADALRTRLGAATPAPRLVEIGIEDEYALLGSFFAGPAALRAFAGSAPLNTDDRPVVAYRAPRATYAPSEAPRDRLIALLREVSIAPAELLAPSDGDREQRLAAYWTARDRFIELGRDVRPSADVRAMLAQVREPLLAVLRISPDFRPAYDPLLLMAAALARTDVRGARALLTELAHAQPARPEAEASLRELGDAPP